MNNKISFSPNKTLKLNNVLIFETTTMEDMNFDLEVKKMENYIKSKGHQPIGPHIQYMEPQINNDGAIEVTLKFLRQSNNYINRLDPPYSMEPVLRVKDCMYVRYSGDESKIKFAYDKIHLTAFEEDIELKGSSYTIFVNRMDDMIVADVYMEKKHD
jgi:hypothetical protein